MLTDTAVRLVEVVRSAKPAFNILSYLGYSLNFATQVGLSAP